MKSSQERGFQLFHVVVGSIFRQVEELQSAKQVEKQEDGYKEVKILFS